MDPHLLLESTQVHEIELQQSLNGARERKTREAVPTLISQLGLGAVIFVTTV